MSRILVVDDSNVAVEKLAMDLRHLGHEDVVLARSASQARERLEQDPSISLILSDFRMPGENGLQLLQSLAERKAKGDLAFVLVTAEPEVEIKKQAKELGANGFISKPVSGDQLSDIIEKVRADGQTFHDLTGTATTTTDPSKLSTPVQQISFQLDQVELTLRSLLKKEPGVQNALDQLAEAKRKLIEFL